MTVEDKEFAQPVIVRDDLPEEPETNDDTLSASDEIRARAVKRREEEVELELSGKERDVSDSNEDTEDTEYTSEETPEKDSELVRVVINGDERFVSKEKIDQYGGVINYQKAISANEGLQELARQRKLLQNEREEIAQQRLALYEKPRTDLPYNKDSLPDNRGSLALNPRDRGQIIKQYHAAVYDGDDDLAAELLDRITSTSQAAQQPTVNEDVIISKAVNRLRAETQQRDFQNAVTMAQERFDNEFDDIAHDPIARSVANEQTKVLARDNPEWTPEQIVMEAGYRTREWLGKFGQGTAQGDTENKLRAKENLGAVRPASRRSPTKPLPQVETTSDYITSIRKARGLE